MAKRAFCPSCAEEVDVFITISEGDETPHCSQCGLILKKDEKPSGTTLSTVIIADDSASLRTVVNEFLTSRKIARNVISAENGKDFLSLITRLLKEKVQVSLVILDINMPVVDGINAAKTMRAIEEGMRVSKKIPILFFSVVRADENMRKLLDFLKPAAYLNKGKNASPSELAERLTQILTQLMKK